MYYTTYYLIYIEFKINHTSTYCMLIHEHDIFYIDFILFYDKIGITGKLIKLFNTIHIMFFKIYI